MGCLMLYAVSLVRSIKKSYSSWYIKKAPATKPMATSKFLCILFLISCLLFTTTNCTDNSLSQSEVGIFQQKQRNIDSINRELKETKAELDSAKIKIKKLNNEAYRLNAKINVYKEVISEIKHKSGKPLELFMTQWITIKPNETWHATKKIRSGYIIKFYGFREGLLLEYDEKKLFIPSWDGKNPASITIFGRNNQDIKWAIRNTLNQHNEGKIQVFSAEGIESSDWDRLEKKITAN